MSPFQLPEPREAMRSSLAMNKRMHRVWLRPMRTVIQETLRRHPRAPAAVRACGWMLLLKQAKLLPSAFQSKTAPTGGLRKRQVLRHVHSARRAEKTAAHRVWVLRLPTRAAGQKFHKSFEFNVLCH
mmetsp:Transcript_57392/g.134370  ORF Transcript_57392/g.134370 Transcript_57392/m.134370 type:complete len:127 (+) Transcript_57392:852-1232(+)